MPELWSQESKTPPPIEIENADEAELMQGEEGKDGVLKLRGRIRIKLPDGQVIANTVIIDTKNQEIYAEGNLVYKGKDHSHIRAERIIYNRRLAQGILYNAAGYKKPVYFIGKNIRQLADRRLAVSHVRFTTNAARPPHYHFSAQRVSFYEDNTFFASGILYHIGGVPLLPLPFLYSSPLGTGIITQLGRGDTQGNFIQNTYQFGVPRGERSSSFLPEAYSFSLDYYQNTGESLGVQLLRYTPELDYHIDLGYARFQRYDIQDGEITNQVESCDGGNDGTPRTCRTAEESYDWHKSRILFNSKKNDAKHNHVRNIHFFYENYSHYLYEYEFGRRFIPEATIPALYRELRINESLLRPHLDWRLVYEEQWDTLYFSLDALHKEVWRERQNFQDSDYEPAQDIIPELTIEKRLPLGRLPGFDTTIDWYHRIKFKSRKDYEEGDELYNLDRSEYSTDFDLALPLLYWLQWDLKAGYGARRTMAQINTDDPTARTSLELEAERDSYQYWFSENQFNLGSDPFLLEITHRYKDPFKEDRADIPHIDTRGFAYNQNVNETQFDLEWFALSSVSFNLHTTYDHRQFPEDVPSKNRWHYPVFRSDIFLNWLYLFQEEREDLLSRNKVHFFDTRLSNDHVYDPVRNESHSNVFGISFEAGGYDLWLLRRLRYFEMGFQWYHVYFDPSLDHLRYILKADVQLGKWSYLETVVESRASEPKRYRQDSLDRDGNSDHVTIWQDILNGTGVNGAGARKNAVFNLVYFRTSLIFDLVDWEFRLGYELEQRYIPQTASTRDSLIYYDHRLSFGLNLIRFDIGGYGQRPSRFLLERQRPSRDNF